MLYIEVLVVCLNVLFIFFVVILVFRLIMRLISEMFGMGMCKVRLWSFFFRCGSMSESVFVVFVVVGMIDLLYVCVWCKFLCGLLIFFWLFVYVWIVVISLFLMLNFLFSIFIIGVR